MSESVALDIRISGVDEIIEKFGVIQANTILRPPMLYGLNLIESEMKSVPPPIARGHWRTHTTPQQRRFFFAALRAGAISGRRTLTLSRTWTKEIHTESNGLWGEVGNNTPYAPWVQSGGFQANFHVGRWQTDVEVVSEHAPSIIQKFEEVIDFVLTNT